MNAADLFFRLAGRYVTVTKSKSVEFLMLHPTGGSQCH